jgi:hypothetical protein
VRRLEQHLSRRPVIAQEDRRDRAVGGDDLGAVVLPGLSLGGAHRAGVLPDLAFSFLVLAIAAPILGLLPATTGLFVGIAGYAILASRALPRWMGWFAVVSAGLCALSIPGDACRRRRSHRLLQRRRLGPKIVANVPPLIWFVVVRVVMVRKRSLAHRRPLPRPLAHVRLVDRHTTRLRTPNRQPEARFQGLRPACW